eukprot:3444859-Alexandrium_andersonii.AAC.1
MGHVTGPGNTQHAMRISSATALQTIANKVELCSPASCAPFRVSSCSKEKSGTRRRRWSGGSRGLWFLRSAGNRSK